MRKKDNPTRSAKRPKSKLIARLKKMTDRLRFRRRKSVTPDKRKDDQSLLI